MSQHHIFGYGSLINIASLRASVPNAHNLQPCLVKGFVRDFSILDPVGFNLTNLDVAGQPFCALNSTPIDNPDDLVNGVLFSVDDVAFASLLEREALYEQGAVCFLATSKM